MRTRCWRSLCYCSSLLLSRSCRHLAVGLDGADAELALAHDRVDPGDLLADGVEPAVALELTGRRLEAEVEQLLLGLPQLGGDLVVLQRTQGGHELVLHAAHLDLLAPDEPALHRELVHRPTHRLAGDGLGNARELEHDPTRLHVGDPPLGRALAGAHPRLGRLLRERAVGVDVDPDLATTLDVTGHRDTRRLDLPVGDVGGLDGLDAVVAEGDRRPALRSARATRVVLLSVLDPAGDQHAQASVPVVVSAGTGASAATGVSVGSLPGSSRRVGRAARTGRCRWAIRAAAWAASRSALVAEASPL